ncbi:MAG: hypothetical protein AAGK78_00500 [Planctomycetota bacterium]
MPEPLVIASSDKSPVQQIAAAAGVTLPDDFAWLEAVGAGVMLWDNDLVWYVASRSGRTIAPQADVAKRLMMELHELEPHRGVLVHRAGWPFDLKTTPIDKLPAGGVTEFMPTGPGDEVMREFIESSDRDVWVWGAGNRPAIDSATVPKREVVGDLDADARGLARLLGWAVSESG